MGCTVIEGRIFCLGKYNRRQSDFSKTAQSLDAGGSLSRGRCSGNRFGSVKCCQRNLVSEGGEFTPLYQGRFSNVYGGEKMTMRIKGDDIFFFLYNLVFDVIFY